MKINLKYNSSLVSIFENPNQIITLDANFLICPNRKNLNFDFEVFKSIWLSPILESFSNLAIHESVYDELVDIKSKSFVDNNRHRIRIHKDSSLNSVEKILRNTIEARIAINTKYVIEEDNKDDRGEVKSLAHIAVKNYIYFASNDYNAINLIENAEEWNTGLDDMRAIKMYEIIYYLYKNNIVNGKTLRLLYKYQYHLTEREKSINPNWGEFITKMDKLYEGIK
ncbi:hypothetical protein EOM09_03000 [bacterium]|nr:hypothetical protein [bacterium]